MVNQTKHRIKEGGNYAIFLKKTVSSDFSNHFKNAHFKINEKKAKEVFLMNNAQQQERAQRADYLKVFYVSDADFMVESSDGKICYKVTLTNDSGKCTCPDYVTRSKNVTAFKCKHIIAVEGSMTTNEINQISTLDRPIPRLDERFIIKVKVREKDKVKEKDFVLYQGLLDLSHQKGLWSLSAEILQYPSQN